ncbi:MAG: serine/threonine protein kinase [Gemmataceae bacterium]|nr:serine/threonine protein kinase [Gemmataceae bacterium]
MLRPHQRLDDFEILHLLGKGGMGEVYEAQQSHPARRVALKVLAPWLAADEEALERFRREAGVPALLDHPSIVNIIVTGKVGDVAYYAMQLVRGISLAQLLRLVSASLPETVLYSPSDTAASTGPSGPPPFSTEASRIPIFEQVPSVLKDYQTDRFAVTARVGVQAARALAAAHKLGFLHRDLKPSNLMVDHHDQIYLLDFGLTRALHSATMTQAGIVVGTPWYMSPEQARAEPLDPRSDLFSLGVTLYQLATCGKGPYHASRDDATAILEEVRKGRLEPLSALAPGIPPELDRIIMHAMELNPALRYQNADDMAADLQGFLEQRPVLPKEPAPSPSSEIAPLHRPWRKALLPSGIVLFVGLVIAAFLLWPRSRDLATYFQRERTINVPLPLLRADLQPVRHQRVLGDGWFHPIAPELVLQSPARIPTLLALDYPDSRAFEFAVELRAHDFGRPEEHDLGIFFGWQDELADPLARKRFFALRLDKRAVLKDIHGRLYIGTWLIEESKGARGGVIEQAPRPIKIHPSWIALAPPPPKFDGWYKVWVRVEGSVITASVNNETPLVFEVERIRDVWGLKGFVVEPHGALGIWVRNGLGHFRNATITKLPNAKSK